MNRKTADIKPFVEIVRVCVSVYLVLFHFNMETLFIRIEEGRL